MFSYDRDAIKMAFYNEHGGSVRRLRAISGVSEHAIYDLFENRADISIYTVWRIAYALNVKTEIIPQYVFHHYLKSATFALPEINDFFAETGLMPSELSKQTALRLDVCLNALDGKEISVESAMRLQKALTLTTDTALHRFKQDQYTLDAKKVRDAWHATGLSAHAFVEKAHVSEHSFLFARRGRPIGIAYARKIAEALGIGL